jgi:hypothetical protein
MVDTNSSSLAAKITYENEKASKSQLSPFDSLKGDGHLARILQKVGIANFPVVLLRRVTTTMSFHGFPATCSSKGEIKKTANIEEVNLGLGGVLVSQAWRPI